MTRDLPAPTAWYRIAGRGLVAAFSSHQLPEDVEHPKEFMDETVNIDGHPYIVKNVEYFGTPYGGRYEHAFGLVVVQVKS